MNDSRYTRDLPEHITLAVGQTVRIPLRGAMGAGNSWQARTDDHGVQAIIDVTPPKQPVPTGNGLPPATSAAAETLLVTGMSAAMARIQLSLGRSWQPGTLLAQHELEVIVTPR